MRGSAFALLLVGGCFVTESSSSSTGGIESTMPTEAEATGTENTGVDPSRGPSADTTDDPNPSGPSSMSTAPDPGETSDGETGTDDGDPSTTGADTGDPEPCTQQQPFTGQATWYELATPLVNCSYETPTLPAYYGALNTAQYADAAVCGACARVNGPEGSVDIQIVDQCPVDSNPICTFGHIDLNPPAFDLIGDPVQGIIPISWEFIPCDHNEPIAYVLKEGTSQFWAAVQVRRHRYAIASLEYRNGNGDWVAMAREDFNFFIAESGMGQPPYTLRVTDIHGQILTDGGIPLQLEVEIDGHAQFPACI